MSRINREDDLAQMLQRMEDRIKMLEQLVRTSCFKTGDLRIAAVSSQLDGWIECDGRTLLRSAYPSLNKLFLDLGYPFGNGNGTTTFNIPDFRGRVPVGAGTGTGGGASGGAGTAPSGGTALTLRSLGAWTGQETVAITAAQTGIRNHVHGGTTQGADRSLDHLHSMYYGTFGGAGKNLISDGTRNFARGDDVSGVGGGNGLIPAAAGGFAFGLGVGGADRSLDHLHGFNTNNPTGGEQSGAAHTNVQPQLAVTYFIKT